MNSGNDGRSLRDAVEARIERLHRNDHGGEHLANLVGDASGAPVSPAVEAPGATYRAGAAMSTGVGRADVVLSGAICLGAWIILGVLYPVAALWLLLAIAAVLVGGCVLVLLLWVLLVGAVRVVSTIASTANPGTAGRTPSSAGSRPRTTNHGAGAPSSESDSTPHGDLWSPR